MSEDREGCVALEDLLKAFSKLLPAVNTKNPPCLKIDYVQRGGGYFLIFLLFFSTFSTSYFLHAL